MEPPVVVYNNIGQAYIPSHDRGKIVPTGDINALTDAIYKIKSNPPSVADCRARAEQIYDKDKSFVKYIDLYNSILSRK